MKSQNTNIFSKRIVLISHAVCLVLLVALIIVGVISCNTTQQLKSTQRESASSEIVESETSSESTTKDYQISVEPIVERTLYDDLTLDEISLLEIVVQHEVGNFSKRYKTYVAELIYNRLVSEKFPGTIHDVLFQEGQFQGIATWSTSGGVVPDEETKVVVKEVFSNENPSHNCTFYYNPELSEYDSVVWFENSDTINYVFSYTERSWGREYTTRFFELNEQNSSTSAIE